MPGYTCAFRGCHSKTGGDVALFSVPNDQDGAKLWLKACCRTDLLSRTAKELSTNYKLCEHHFQNKYYTTGTSRKRLLPDAFPTVFPDAPRRTLEDKELEEAPPKEVSKNIKILSDVTVVPAFAKQEIVSEQTAAKMSAKSTKQPVLDIYESGVKGEVKAAVEINNVANDIYKHNFPHVNLLNLNIEGLTAERVGKLDVDTILMSPPCQPFTRNGNQNDVRDARTDAFQHVLSLLPNLDIRHILIENVKGFEKSEMRNILVRTLNENNFIYQEFILSPAQFGVPNSRHRYYCLATKLPNQLRFQCQQLLMKSLPDNVNEKFKCFEIEDILEEDLDFKKYCLPDKVLRKRLKVLDICYKNNKRSCCFTKAYGRFIEGTGSIYTENSETDVQSKLQKLKEMNNGDDEYLELAKSLNLRFFTPKEIARLMCFPETFSFSNNITDRQKYMVLGNSINVKVVSELIKLF